MIEPANKTKRGSVMVWAAFGGPYERSDLIVMQRDEESKRNGYSAWSYLLVLEEAIPTIYEPPMVFMQDNAPIHTARAVKDWFCR